MNAIDFVYDGQYLSDYGFIIGKRGKGENLTISDTGSKIQFSKVTRYRGNINDYTRAVYVDTYKTTFEIYKNPKISDSLYISSYEFRDIMRWLNRKEFLKFSFIPLDGDETEKYYNASFNLQKIVLKGKLIGISLSMETDSPFGYGQEQTYKFNVKDTNKTFIVSDISDEIGATDLYMEIKLEDSGNLEIENLTYDRKTIIKNCLYGETIVFAAGIDPVTTYSEHDILSNYNFEVPQIANTINNRQNKFRFSLPCTVTIKYTPIIK